MKLTTDWTYLLTDNGSSRPGSWLQLCCTARGLADAAVVPVHPVPMSHAEKVDPGALPEGTPAPRTMERFLAEEAAAGRRRFLVVPLFLGPSGAITRALPRIVDEMRGRYPDLEVEVADVLFDPEEEDEPLRRILADHVRETAAEHELDRPPVILVDHGSPNPAVTAVRDTLGEQLERYLDVEVDGVRVASMERREGEAYTFSGPLLEDALRAEDLRGRDVVLAMLFLSPGRHAGEGGDIDRIVAESPEGVRVHRTALLTDHPDLVRLLARRLRAATASLSTRDATS